VAAVPASRHNPAIRCASCGQGLEGELSPHVCAACGDPQPPPAGAPDYFDVFETPRKFTQDLAVLEKRFYRWSRALHPDRFATRAADLRERSLARMSLLNDAWQTLKNPDMRREHLLSLEGVQAPKTSMPLDLAGEWFELQDSLMENPAEAKKPLVEFEAVLERRSAELNEGLLQFEARWDAQGSRLSLDTIALSVHARNTVDALRRDVALAKARL